MIGDLTDQKIIPLLGKGYSRKEIAAELSLSHRNVVYRILRFYRVFGFYGGSDAVRLRVMAKNEKQFLKTLMAKYKIVCAKRKDYIRRCLISGKRPDVWLK